MGQPAHVRDYLAEAARLVRPGGHVNILESASFFDTDRLIRFDQGAQALGMRIGKISPNQRTAADGPELPDLLLIRLVRTSLPVGTAPAELFR